MNTKKYICVDRFSLFFNGAHYLHFNVLQIFTRFRLDYKELRSVENFRLFFKFHSYIFNRDETIAITYLEIFRFF
jgi:hypothetical protein